MSEAVLNSEPEFRHIVSGQPVTPDADQSDQLTPLSICEVTSNSLT